MIYLAITPSGLNELLNRVNADDAVWCGSDAITETEFKALERPGLTRFIYALGDRQLVDDALSTIEEHHPGQVVWVEGAASAR